MCVNTEVAQAKSKSASGYGKVNSDARAPSAVYRSLCSGTQVKLKLG